MNNQMLLEEGIWHSNHMSTSNLYKDQVVIQLHLKKTFPQPKDLWITWWVHATNRETWEWTNIKCLASLTNTIPRRCTSSLLWTRSSMIARSLIWTITADNLISLWLRFLTTTEKSLSNSRVTHKPQSLMMKTMIMR